MNGSAGLRAREFPGWRYNFNPGTLGTTSRRVRAALVSFGEDDDRAAFPLGAYGAGREGLVRVRASARALWGEGDVAFGAGTTAQMNLLVHALARTLRIRGSARHVVLTTAHEHEGGVGGFEAHPDYAVRYCADAALSDPGRWADDVRAARPEVVLLSQITWTEGRILPLAEMVDAVRHHAPHAWVIVDAAQALGATRPALGLGDVTVASAHKWLCGPPGTGFTWVGARAREALGGVSWVGHPLDPESPLPQWEVAGGQDFARYAGLAAAMDLYGELGIEAARRHSAALAARFASGFDRLLGEAGVRRAWFDPESAAWGEAPTAVGAPTLAVRFDAFDPYPLYARLNAAGVHLKCVKGRTAVGGELNQLRIGLPWYETDERVDEALARVEGALNGSADYKT